MQTVTFHQEKKKKEEEWIPEKQFRFEK